MTSHPISQSTSLSRLIATHLQALWRPQPQPHSLLTIKMITMRPSSSKQTQLPLGKYARSIFKFRNTSVKFIFNSRHSRAVSFCSSRPHRKCSGPLWKIIFLNPKIRVALTKTAKTWAKTLQVATQNESSNKNKVQSFTWRFLFWIRIPRYGSGGTLYTQPSQRLVLLSTQTRSLAEWSDFVCRTLVYCAWSMPGSTDRSNSQTWSFVLLWFGRWR